MDVPTPAEQSDLAADAALDDVNPVDEVLVEEVSIDGMCGVY